MAKVFKPIFVQTVKTEDVQYTNADSAATNKVLYAAGAEGGLANDISVSSTDTSIVELQLFVKPSGGAVRLIGTVSIPVGAGNTDGVPPVSLLDSANISIFTQADGSLPLEALGELSISNVTQVTAATQIDIVAFCGDY